MVLRYLNAELPTVYATLAHFMVLFGYKMFSLYYPLFLEERGFEIADIGIMYLLIYATIGAASPLINEFLKGKNPYYFIPVSIGGYALYSLGMIFSRTVVEFYFWQIFLGVSSALFYVSARTVIMRAEVETYDREFFYFYSAPFYSMVLAPFIGGIILWKLGFAHVFAASVAIYMLGILLCVLELKQSHLNIRKRRTSSIKSGVRIVFSTKNIVMLAASLAALFSVGMYRSFFILFLENEFSFDRLAIVTWVVVTSLTVSFLCWKTAKSIKRKSEENLLRGNLLSGVMAVLLSITGAVPILFAVYICENLGRVVSESGKSAFLTKMFNHSKEEGAMFDTVLTSLGVAAGALIGGVLGNWLGLRAMFFINGVFLLMSVAALRRVNS